MTASTDFINWVDSNEGMSYIAEKTARGWVANRGSLDAVAGLSFIYTVQALVIQGGRNSDASVMYNDVDFGEVDAEQVAVWLNRYNDLAGMH